MRREVLEQLTAPGGGAPLTVASIAEARGADIVEGAALSPQHGLYPISGGILDLLPRGAGPLSPAQTSNLLAGVAWGYEWTWRAASLTLLSRERLPFEREQQLFEALLGEATGGLWLDLGASTGLYGRWLAPRVGPHGGEVVALDFAPPMLRQAQAQAARAKLHNLSFVVARGEQLPLATGTLAGVVCGGSLNEFGATGAKRVLQEVARALRPGGVGLFMHLLASEAGMGQRAQRYLARPSGIAFWDRAASNHLFTRAGLAVEATQDFGVVGFTQVRRLA